VRAAVAYARSQGVDTPMLWLDVETVNHWSGIPDLNAVVVQGAIDAARGAGLHVGAYSTPFMWARITGPAYRPGIPAWYAIGRNNGMGAPRHCGPGFTGGHVLLEQHVWGGVDENVICPAMEPVAADLFRM